ncbi:hypothetical protein COCMIDRAFT_33565 [Bipolaris oryzae ATCC 44560]|uniref:Uncharacterized protein n=1 Tax=Bipolaris oryzae ATCC 44560 TaxID=930090 RepID=W6ZNJ1_COCMI|nr:uncharacterized protein COCMIDRAFT_33565 [Bipolaris oryzae ATCC 44560]EUC49094.1 hypothetical protein COCMIDRAFT_33565 [Bipolaris oryzae ATCC 44560]
MAPHRNSRHKLGLSNILARDFSQKVKGAPSTGSRLAYAIAPAGPDALAGLRTKIYKHLLSNLLDWRSLKFSAYSKPMGYARLPALVYAYLKPTSSSVTGPTLAVEITRTRVVGDLNSEIVIREQAINKLARRV